MVPNACIQAISIPLSAVLLVAAVTVHWQYGFSSIELRAVTAAGPQFAPPGYETDLLYLAAIATLVIGRSGPWTTDEMIARRRAKRARRGAEPSRSAAC